MISDGAIYDKDAKIPMKLIKQLLGITGESSFDPYISSMVKAYIRRKRQIVINFDGLRKMDSTIKGFITEGKVQKLTHDENWNPKSLSSSRCNIVSSNILSVFPNAVSVIINTRAKKTTGYAFDMFYFVTVIIKASNWESITIEQKMSNPKNFNKSWISKLWHAAESELVHHYNQYQLEISFGKRVKIMPKGFADDCYEYFTIRRA